MPRKKLITYKKPDDRDVSSNKRVRFGHLEKALSKKEEEAVLAAENDVRNGMSIREVAKKYNRTKHWGVLVHKRVRENYTENIKKKEEEERNAAEEEFVEGITDFDRFRDSLTGDLIAIEKLSRRLEKISDQEYERYGRKFVNPEKQERNNRRILQFTLAAQAAIERSARIKIDLVKTKIAMIERAEDRVVNITINRKPRKESDVRAIRPNNEELHMEGSNVFIDGEKA